MASHYESTLWHHSIASHHGISLWHHITAVLYGITSRQRITAAQHHIMVSLDDHIMTNHTMQSHHGVVGHLGHASSTHPERTVREGQQRSGVSLQPLHARYVRVNASKQHEEQREQTCLSCGTMRTVKTLEHGPHTFRTEENLTQWVMTLTGRPAQWLHWAPERRTPIGQSVRHASPTVLSLQTCHR